MALCIECLRCTHNEPLINGVCDRCYDEEESLDTLEAGLYDDYVCPTCGKCSELCNCEGNKEGCTNYE